MQIAVLSDIHDSLDHLAWAQSSLMARQADLCVCCGDFSRATTLETMATWPLPIYFCLGNTDHAREHDFAATARRHANLHFHSQKGRLTLPQGDIFFTHYPETAHEVAKRGDYIAVFFGHTHQRHAERLGTCLLANPGDIQNRYGDGPSFLLWESETGNYELVIKP